MARLSRQARTAIVGSLSVAQTGAAALAVLLVTVRDGGGNAVSGKVIQLIVVQDPAGPPDTTVAATAGFTGNAFEVGVTHTEGLGVTGAAGTMSFDTTNLTAGTIVYAICGGVAARFTIVA